MGDTIEAQLIHETVFEMCPVYVCHSPLEREEPIHHLQMRQESNNENMMKFSHILVYTGK